jgi:hypothetical protein
MMVKIVLPAELAHLSRAELQQLEATPLMLDDLLLKGDRRVPQTQPDEELERCRARAAEALHQNRSEIVKRRSAERLAALYKAGAHRAEAEAEDCLQEAVEAPGTMDDAALANFRQRYVQLQTAKHRRAALRELLPIGYRPK